jgi:FMN phosphatase YigB (HAD superfamily)
LGRERKYMIKVLLIDADGVLITGKYFSDRLAEQYGVPIEDILPFFKNEFKQCTLGKADLKEELAKYIPRWNWKDSLENLLDFWFSGNKVDEKILDILSGLRRKGIKCYLVSDNEKYRAQYLMNQMNLNAYLDGAFFSCEMGCNKSDNLFFEKILSALPQVKPEEMAYCDDDEQNLKIAKQFGIKTEFYGDFRSFENWTKNL